MYLGELHGELQYKPSNQTQKLGKMCEIYTPKIAQKVPTNTIVWKMKMYLLSNMTILGIYPIGFMYGIYIYLPTFNVVVICGINVGIF